MNILVLNAGSSSQKSSLYQLQDDLPSDPPLPLWEAHLDWGRSPQTTLTVQRGDRKQTQTFVSTSRSEDTHRMLQSLWQGEEAVLQHPNQIHAVGHRVVHGGADYSQSVRITSEVKEAIAHLSSLAPAHNPANLDGIVTIEAILGDRLPQVAVFDTAFHRHIPDAAALYAIPQTWSSQGIRRYGFHGISHHYCTQRAAHLLQRPVEELRLITCHLGNGASLAAVHQGHSIDTTMGFTPLDGLMMGSRCGSIDPGVLLYLMRQEGLSVEDVDRLLNKQSGLLGVSGRSADMRDILAAASEDPSAQLALDMYIYRLRSHLGAMWMSLGTVDALVFTAGVGEHSPEIRAAVCDGLGAWGVQLDRDRNLAHPVDQIISAPNSAVQVLVIHTQEDWAIAQECWRLLNASQSQPETQLT